MRNQQHAGPADTIIEIGRRIYDKGFCAASDGNISIRVNSTIHITASGVCKGLLSPQDVVTFDLGAPFHARASSETALHVRAYELRKDIGCIIHAHPPYTTALSLIEESYPHDLIPELLISLGRIETIPYATPGTGEVAQHIRPLAQSNAVLLKNHGALTIAGTADKAYYYLEKLEHSSKIIWLALMSGKNLSRLPEHEIARLETLRE